jgi:hypothetical protein
MPPKIDQVSVETPPLYLPIDDAQLLAVIDEAEKKASQEKNKEHVSDRGKQNINFWLGKQVDDAKLDSRYQQAHVDNVAFQDLETQIKLASGKIPDIFCAPPDSEEYNMEAARDMQSWIRERVDTATIKRLVKNGLRKMNLELLAVIKPRWDYVSNDFTFELLQTADMLFSEGSKIPEDGFTIDGTEVTIQYVEESTQVILAKFKKKAEALKAEVGAVTKKQDLPARLRYTEVHFRWFDDQGRMSEGVAWRYGNLILDSMKEPYYDYDNPQINYFDRPRKPYILLSYLNLGKSVYEATTDFEQAMPINRIINKRRRQITEISDRAVPKMVFSGGSLTKETARNISPSPNEGILLEGKTEDIRKSVFIIPSTPPNPILFSDLQDLRGRVDSIFSTHNITNIARSRESGVSKQISRESDLVTSDDIVSVVVERVVTELSQWAMQFARLFYDDDRKPLRMTNEEGDTQFVELNRKKIETDIQIIVKGSTNDKATRRSDALQMLTGKVTDPYTLFEDLDVPNPKERTRRLMAFIQAQQDGNWQKYLDMVGIDMATNKADEADAQKDIEILLQGGQPDPGRDPSESYVSTFISFVNSPAYGTYDQPIRDRVTQYIDSLKAALQQKDQAQPADQSSAAQPPGVAGALQGAPGVTPPPVDYQPTVDTSTVFSGAPGAAAATAKSHFMSQMPTRA